MEYRRFFYCTRVVSAPDGSQAAKLLDLHFGRHKDVRLRLGHLYRMGNLRSELTEGPTEDELYDDVEFRLYIEEDIDEWTRLLA